MPSAWEEFESLQPLQAENRLKRTWGERCQHFSWVNAMKGYHYLMRMAHLFNTLARFARHLKALYAELGVRGAIAFIRQSCAAPWLDAERIRTLLNQPFQLQLE